MYGTVPFVERATIRSERPVRSKPAKSDIYRCVQFAADNMVLENLHRTERRSLVSGITREIERTNRLDSSTNLLRGTLT